MLDQFLSFVSLLLTGSTTRNHYSSDNNSHKTKYQYHRHNNSGQSCNQGWECIGGRNNCCVWRWTSTQTNTISYKRHPGIQRYTTYCLTSTAILGSTRSNTVIIVIGTCCLILNSIISCTTEILDLNRLIGWWILSRNKREKHRKKK